MSRAARPTGAIVFGGYGTFGSIVCRELARSGTIVTVAGRSRDLAEELARALGPGHRALVADAADLASCRTAVAGHAVAVGCAGPFATLGSGLLEACVEARCHYVDIADDRGHARYVRSLGDRLRQRGLTAVYGCSSLPGLSGALALLVAGGAAEPAERARVTLFIGNVNPKGEAAIASLVAGLGRPIAAPQGPLRSFADRELVTLPAPFGRRAVYNFESPDYDLLPSLIGVRAVWVKVGFELRAVALAFAVLARASSGYGPRMARFLARVGKLPIGGSSAGVVMAELVWPDGSCRRAALHAGCDGQRMAALPAALAARALEAGAAAGRGALAAYELFGAPPLLEQVAGAGFSLLRE